VGGGFDTSSTEIGGRGAGTKPAVDGDPADGRTDSLLIGLAEPGPMAERTFDRETLLDLTVNVIPLGIILFFVVLFLLIRPWEQNLFLTVVSMALLVVPFVSLTLLTYLSGRVIAGAERTDASPVDGDSSTLESGSKGATSDLSEGVTADTADENRDENGETDDLEPAVTETDAN
jgi:hypothetical protein